MRRWFLAALSMMLAAPAQAAVERYALIVGNNSGGSDEPNLRFAEADASKVADVLTQIGGFAPENVVIIRGQGASDFRRALISLNDRIRARTGTADPLLFVYFSGHADARSLHLKDSSFELRELEELVRGSAALFRLLVVDACRSGALTRVKGGSVIPPFAIELDEHLGGEGVVFLTSSAAGEDAQESEQLGGSFFTHYLVSGLLGAADSNGDGRIALREAYHHAYEHTLRASSRTLAGPQHPTFNYELRGHGDLVLTEPYRAADRAIIELPGGASYLIFSGSAEGAVVAEIGTNDRRRQLGLRPGEYFIRSRGRAHLLEGAIRLSAGERRRIEERSLERIEYARLVRKGFDPLPAVFGGQLGAQLRSGLFEGDGLCLGLFAEHRVDLAPVGFLLRASFCRAHFSTQSLEASTSEVALDVGIAKAWDLPPATFELGVDAGLALIGQSFSTRGLAPDRWSLAPLIGARAIVEVELGAGFFLAGDAGGAIYLASILQEQRAQLVAAPVLRTSIGVGKRW